MAQIILDSNSNLIQGDFDAATVNNRTKLQTSTTNATTGVYVVPNGSATSASVQIANAADPTNASKLVVATNASTDTQIVSGANGSGSYLPLSFYTNNDIRFQMGNAGELNVRTAPGTVSSGSSGQVLTSGGPGSGVSWAAAPSGFTTMQVFTTPGTFTTPSTTTKIKVTVVGGGASSAGSGGPTAQGRGGAGGGGTAIYVGPVTASTPYAVTVGTGGTAPAPNNNVGIAGGTSSFASLASATGGAAGPISINGSAGGAGSAGTLLFNGGYGSVGSILASSPTTGVGGFGGSSFFAGTSYSGVAGLTYGGGGGGTPAGPLNTAGFAGAGGVVVVEY
jgi:hypothetical protein